MRWVFSRWREVATWTVEARAEDVVISRGRLSRKRTTIRAAKVSAVVLEQGPVRRRFGWWAVRVSVSALDGSGSDEDRASVCAVATEAEVVGLLSALVPDLPMATRSEIVAALGRPEPAPHWVGADRFGRWWSPLGWRFTAG